MRVVLSDRRPRDARWDRSRLSVRPKPNQQMRADPRASCAIATRVAPTRSRPPAPHHTTQRKRSEPRPCRSGFLLSLRARICLDRTQRSTEMDPFVIRVRRLPHTHKRAKSARHPLKRSSYTAQKMPVRERVTTNTRGRGGSRVARVRKDCPGSVRITARFERGSCAHLHRWF